MTPLISARHFLLHEYLTSPEFCKCWYFLDVLCSTHVVRIPHVALWALCLVPLVEGWFLVFLSLVGLGLRIVHLVKPYEANYDSGLSAIQTKFDWLNDHFFSYNLMGQCLIPQAEQCSGVEGWVRLSLHSAGTMAVCPHIAGPCYCTASTLLLFSPQSLTTQMIDMKGVQAETEEDFIFGKCMRKYFYFSNLGHMHSLCFYLFIFSSISGFPDSHRICVT